MKQTIITILLAVAAMTGQAQVRTGQDVCLRNEATGDWLIGLFDNYAVSFQHYVLATNIWQVFRIVDSL